MGNRNALKHGFYGRPSRPLRGIDDAIEHLAQALGQLAAYMDRHDRELTVEETARLHAVLGQNLRRYSRMLWDKARMAGDEDEELRAQIQEALRLAGAKMGVEL